ncbi:MAG: CinA family protein [Deltaproteobacteria bacterium]|nr:MAG: CinA family protein [Deltaproteobacteria bacterium]
MTPEKRESAFIHLVIPRAEELFPLRRVWEENFPGEKGRFDGEFSFAFPSWGEAEAFLRSLPAELRGRATVGRGKTLEEELILRCVERGVTVAVAESCTGGRVSARITSVPGSSRVFLGGVVAYSNEAKRDLLGVSHQLLSDRGAVSREVVLAMAEGVRRTMGADVSVAVSGIAGPEGGSPEKPVGTVWFALDTGGRKEAERFLLQGSRWEIQDGASSQALWMLLEGVSG